LHIIEKMAGEGIMPNMARLMKDGAKGELKSTYPPNSLPAWTSFMTGKYPGKHGVFDFIRKIPGSYELEVVTSSAIKEDALWDILDKYKMRSVLINFPITYPAKRISGIMITGMLSPDENSNFIYPGSLRQELEEQVGRYIIDVEPLPYLKNDNIDQFLKDLMLMTTSRCDTALYCLEREDWDFFMVLFVGLDRLQHTLWDCVDLKTKDAGLKDVPKYLDSVRGYFSYIDSVIAKILEKAGNDTNIFIISDHGFGPLRRKIDINNWLAQNGLLKFKKSKEIFRHAISALKYLGIDRCKVKNFARNFGLQVDNQIRELTLSIIDWSKTKAFSCLSDAIYINLKGRERYGIVEFPEEYEKIRDEIIEKLPELRDPQSGEKVIYRVLKAEDLYPDNGAESLPDLFITEYDRRYLHVPVWSAGYREIGGSIFVDAQWQTGAHRLNGLLVGYGPDIKSVNKLEDAEIVDVLPTILSLLKVPIPQDLEGKVLVDILK